MSEASSAGASASGRDAGRALAWPGPWLAALLGAALFVPTLTHDFTYDDRPLVRHNPRIRDVGDVRGIWLTDWWARQTDDANEVADPMRDRLYRPLTLFTFALNYAVGGVNPVGYHAVNVALHGVVCGLVWVLALRVTQSRAAAFVAAILFAVHPVHVEAVAGVVGRAELLSAMFLILGLLALWPRGGSPGVARTALAAGAFLAALLAKETAICYPALAAVVLWEGRRRGAAGAASARTASRRWLGLVLLVVPLLIYFPMRITALEGHVIRAGSSDEIINPLFRADAWGRVHGPLTVLGHYVRLLVWPVRLSSDYGLAVIDPAAGVGVLTLVGLAAAVGLVFGAVAWLRGVGGPIGLLCALFVASYVLISNAVLLIGVTVAERLMYWPSALVMIGIGHAAACWWSRQPAGAARRAAATAGSLAVVLLGVRSVARAADWSDNLRLFSTDARTHPRSVQLSVAYAFVAAERARETQDFAARDRLLAEADAALDRALALHGRHPKALQGKGLIAEQLGDVRQARQWFELAVQYHPADQFSLAQLARLGGGSGDSAKMAELRRKIKDDPGNVALRLELGAMQLAGARHVDALQTYEEAMRMAGDDLGVMRGYAQALLLNNQFDRAREQYLRLVERDPEDWNTHVNLARLLHATDPQATLAHCEAAARLAPPDPRAQVIVRGNLAEALALVGRFDAAIATYEALLDQLPAGDANRPSIEDRLRSFRSGRR